MSHSLKDQSAHQLVRKPCSVCRLCQSRGGILALKIVSGIWSHFIWPVLLTEVAEALRPIVSGFLQFLLGN